MDNSELGNFDVIVIGGGTSGVPAAISAARGGCKTLLVERTSGLGGLMTTGMPALGILDRKLNKVVGGIAEEIIHQLQEDGLSFGNLRCPLHNSITTVHPWWYKIVSAEKCKAAGVEILYTTSLLEVAVSNSTVTGVVLTSGNRTYSAACKVLIDASGDATAAYLAGANFDFGQPRDLNAVIAEQAEQEKRYHIGSSKAGMVQPVSLTFSLGGVNDEELYRYFLNHPETYETPKGYGMQYDTDYVLNSPAIYITCFGEFIEEAKKNGDFDIPRDRVIFATQPNPGEYLVNATRVVDVDPTNPIELSNATTELYRQVGMLVKFFKKYCPGFENSFLAHIGPFTGIRESRRIRGIKQVTKQDITELRIPKDSIALGGYNCDIHLSGVGLYFQPVEHAVGVPYGALLSENIGGLIVTGRCISVDSYALAVLRVMGACLALGEAAGTAAALAVQGNISVREVNVEQLQSTLLRNGGVIAL